MNEIKIKKSLPKLENINTLSSRNFQNLGKLDSARMSKRSPTDKIHTDRSSRKFVYKEENNLINFSKSKFLNLIK